MNRNFLKSIIKEIILESTFSDDYTFDPTSKEMKDQNGNSLKCPKTGEAVKFGSVEDADEFLKKNSIRGTVEEMTGTGAVAGYSTPFAFSSRGDVSGHIRNIAAKSMPGGKVVGENESEVLEEARSRFRNLSESDLVKHEAKVSYLVAEAHRMLKEVGTIVEFTTRLKNESGIKPRWKRTEKDILGIYSQIKEIAKKLRGIK